jgi:hypothetical protein
MEVHDFYFLGRHRRESQGPCMGEQTCRAGVMSWNSTFVHVRRECPYSKLFVHTLIRDINLGKLWRLDN